jgi:hypothetical protein
MQPAAATDLNARLRIIQSMQAILEQPPSAELSSFIALEVERTADPLFKAFLRTLSTDNEANRATAMEAFKVLERRHQDELAAYSSNSNNVDQSQALTDRMAEYARQRELAGHSPTNDPADIISFMNKGGTGLELVDASFPKDIAVDAPAVQLTGKVVDFPQKKSGVFHPFVDKTDTLEKVKFTLATPDANGEKERIYSIITPNSPFDRLVHISRITGVVVGIQGQHVVDHGFGYLLPFGNADVRFKGNEPIDIKIALEYPNALALYDDHNGYKLPFFSHFMAIHEALADGYRFLLDLKIIPVNGHYALSTQPHCFIDRKDKDGQKQYVSSASLHKLAYAAEKLGIVGFIGEVEVS